jgi:hypothetical protein
MPYIDPTVEQLVKFFKQFEKGRSDECWIWKGTLSNGYGTCCGYKAHVVAYYTVHGPFENDWDHMVLHTCDVRACVNPAHLYLGTHEDNMRDRKERGPKRPKRERVRRTKTVTILGRTITVYRPHRK